jgi:oxygen-independent coproporphyrinogen-3 oxidase
MGTHEKAVRNIKDAGFSRTHVDLIFGLPHQTLEQWKFDIQHAIGLEPDSITTYDCLYRGAGRSFMHGDKKQSDSIPTPQQYGKMYDLAYKILQESGYYAPYGAVNFSKRADETATSRYFQGRLLEGLPYLGIGNYSSTLYNNTWLFAPYTVDEFLIKAGERLFEPDLRLNHPVGDSYQLPDDEIVAKQILLSLSFGVIDPKRIESMTGKPTHEIGHLQQALDFAVDQQWMELHSDGTYRISTASPAFEILPKLRSLFYTSRAISWLEEFFESKSTARPSKAKSSLYL